MKSRIALLLLCAMVSWDALGHASQLALGRDWSQGAPLWRQLLLCGVWFPDIGGISGWTIYNIFWSAYWLTALTLILVAANAKRAAPVSRSGPDALRRGEI